MLIRLQMHTPEGTVAVLADKIGPRVAKLQAPGDGHTGLNRLDRVHFRVEDDENVIDKIIYRGSKTFRLRYKTIMQNGLRMEEITKYFARHKIKVYPHRLPGWLLLSVPRNMNNKKAVAKIKKCPYLMNAVRWPNGDLVIRP